MPNLSNRNVTGRNRLRRALARLADLGSWPALTPARAFALTLVASIAFSVTFALRRGQDVNFDQLNYHLESVHEFLAGRMDIDAAPSGLLHSFFNPLPYVPFYEMALHWPPRATIVAISAWQGLNFALAFAIGWTLAPTANAGLRFLVAALATAVSATGAMTLSEVGGSSSDLSLCPFVLLGVLAFVNASAAEPRRAWALIGAAGFLIGLAIGLKPTHALFAPGFAIAAAIGWQTLRQALVSLIVAGLSGALGVALSGGFWFLTLWRKFRSPMFPYYDGIFFSPGLDPSSMLHGRSYFQPRFLPKTLSDALLLPIRWLSPGTTTAELDFRDIRFAVVIALLAVALVVWLWRRADKPPRKGSSAAEARLIVFVLTACVIWARTFGIQRYIMPVELLLGPSAIVAWRTARLPTLALPPALAAFAAAAALTVVVPDWAHVKPGKSWFALQLPASLQKPSLVLAEAATSYVGPFLPPESVMIGFSRAATLRPGGTGLLEKAFEAAMAREPRLPVVFLVSDLVRPEKRRELAGLGLTFGPACELVPNVAKFLVACPLLPAPPTEIAAPPLVAGRTLRFGSSGEGTAALLSGWNADTAWGNVGPNRSPKLIFRGDDNLAEAPVRLTIRLSGIGDLDDSDMIGLRVGERLIGEWPFPKIGRELTVCAPTGSFPALGATEFVFVDRRPPDAPAPTRLGSLGLESLRAERDGCKSD